MKPHSAVGGPLPVARLDRSPVVTVARSGADVLSEHVVFEVSCVDRMYCNVYVPQLQYATGLVGYVQRQLGLPIASTVPLARITEAFDKAVRRFARDHGLPWVDFAKGHPDQHRGVKSPRAHRQTRRGCPTQIKRQPVTGLPIRKPLIGLQQHHRGHHPRRYRRTSQRRAFEQMGEALMAK